jgi:hypothetical protein
MDPVKAISAWKAGFQHLRKESYQRDKGDFIHLFAEPAEKISVRTAVFSPQLKKRVFPFSFNRVRTIQL